MDPTTTYRTNRRAPADLTLHKASDGVILNLKDFELAAEKRVTAAAWAYFESAADDEISKARNLKSFRKISLRPRILRNVESIDTRTTILGMSTSMPIFVSPCGLNKLAYPSGECAITSAAGKAGLIQVISTGASMSPESIIAARTNKLQPIFFQLYVNKDIQKSKALIRRVENLGFNSIWLTVDSPVLGKRERDAKISSKRQVCGSALPLCYY
jgi:L-lactate dehydrogenase (cytochrome)